MTTAPPNPKFTLNSTTWTEIVPSLKRSGGRSPGLRSRKIASLWVYNPNTTNVTIHGCISDTSGTFDTPDSTWTLFVRELEQDTNYVMPEDEGIILEEDERFLMKLSASASSDVSIVVSVIDL